MSQFTQKYRSQESIDRLIAFSVSYQRDNLLARGLGLEHLRELLLGIARPLLRQGASLVYGGDWEEREGNFTHELLDLIKAEQEDNSLKGPDTSFPIGSLYNHSAWPNYVKITPEIEALWVNCCRIIRVSQEDAGFREDEVLPDSAAFDGSDRFLFNRAYTLSAMRRIMAEGCDVSLPALHHSACVPGVATRILIGGKTDGYQGMMPGIFEEALLAFKKGIPIYLLGGLGGGAELLAKPLVDGPGKIQAVPELWVDYHRENTPDVGRLCELCKEYRKPDEFTPESLFADLTEALEKAAADFPDSLRNGLNAEENQALLTTADITEARRLVRRGLDRAFGMQRLAF